MSDDIDMFAHDIAMYMLWYETPMDALAEKIHAALREGLTSGDHPIAYFRDQPSGTTEIEGEYDLAFVARVIRSAIA